MRMRTSRILRFAVLAALPAIAAMAAYCCSWIVYSARQYTLGTVLPNARSAQYPLSPSGLSRRQIEILLKVEDPQFFQHRGVDFSTPGAGNTTITQSLVKLLYFDKFSPGIAKLKQTLIAAYALNPLMPKDAQLRLFINTAYLGPDVHGFEQAANAYFGKPFKQLGEDEFLAIVAMLIAPETFHVRNYPERNGERVRRIKQLASGEYVPRGVFDVFYGKLDEEIQPHIPPVSYFESYYR